MNKEILLETQALTCRFCGRKSPFSRERPFVTAVDEVSLQIRDGETLGLVGESGCGKSTLGKAILRLIEPCGGRVLYNGQDMGRLSSEELRQMRRQLQLVFQDPYSSLNPCMTAYELVEAPLCVHHIGTKSERQAMVEDMLAMVGIDRTSLYKFPHEFSGGQRQRIGIARALILRPRLIICDEAVSALDVSVRAQILNLLRELQRKMGLTMLFISHDLSVIRHISDSVAVMYLGSIVEIAPKRDLYDNPLHPYTRGLLSAIPIPDVHRVRQGEIPEGEIPDIYHLPPGCKYHARCPMATDICRRTRPELRSIGSDHQVACHLVNPTNC